MTVLPSANCSSQFEAHQANQLLNVSSLLFLITFGKTVLNALTLGLRRTCACHHFMGYFCISLALVDLFLLVSISIISFFREFVLLGIRFTRYHICLLTQIISFTYGFLHYPVFLIACIDYYLVFSKTTQLPVKCQKLFYLLAVILIWVLVLAYVLGDPGIYQSLSAQDAYPYQCPFYISAQSFWVSSSMVLVLGLVLLTFWSEVISLGQAVRVTSYMNEAVLYFPFPSHPEYNVSSKQTLLPKLVICFLGTWLPFVLLQVIVLLFEVQIPAYIEMNIPWLYFVNSFLIAILYWFNYPKLNVRDFTLPVDPFVSWKCCFIPLTIHTLEKMEKPISIIIC
ncbi:probable G-protein coupled receptor 160 [Echinops telfairi]|uniref:Probable G-protein coupled receptor 160 n=1 Tax=Echinops telfairi TaxID=9371 RepID=A0ABM0INJ9_ECHTE|nr:probable G-protein coupled receptor 160 [Echinops telfairi]